VSRAGAKRRFLLALCFLSVLLFTSLGIWQIERRAWKLDLIARVNARVAAAPSPVPPASAWPTLDPREIEYRRVRASGVLLHERETLVDALTERGPGSWVLTPLRTTDGVILVNRGFVPPERRPASMRESGQLQGQVTITGLMRLSEPDGRILRPNRPAEDRWYSRDVAAIAAARDIGKVAPFFIDADASPDPGALPIGGLTIIQFRNTHLVYALTWFGLALLCGAGMVLLLKPAQDPR